MSMNTPAKPNTDTQVADTPHAETQVADTLVADNLSVPFGTLPGLVNVSIRVARGERVVIVGPSGAGKTSLLRAIAGLTPVTQGRVTIASRDVTQLPPEQRGAVYLHQNPLLFPHLDVFENVAFPLRVRGVAKEELRDRVHEALQKVQLHTLSRRAPASLSGGQAHRAALARAVVGRPELLLLDEPFSSLDPSLRDEVRDALVALQAEFKLSMLLITHDLHEAGRLAERIAVLKDGGILQIGNAVTMFDAPISPAVAVAMGRRTILKGTVSPSGELQCALGAVALDAPTLAALGVDLERAPLAVDALFLPGALSLVSPALGQPSFRVERIHHGGDYPSALIQVGPTSLEVSMSPADTVGVSAALPIVVGTRVSVCIAPLRVRLFKP